MFVCHDCLAWLSCWWRRQSGAIEPSRSEWSSPVVIVPKKHRTLRVCIDFRKLNAQSRFDAYLMPRIDDLLERIGQARYITTLDLCKGYWQVTLDNDSKQYTAFRTPSGLYHFTVLPFGLHGAPAKFQRLMDQVLRGCEGWAAAYLDDVVIFSNSWEEHLTHMLKRIREAGLTLNVKKWEWARQETSYLGYHLGNGKLRPQVDKVEAIRRSPRPRSKKEMRCFLGLVGWYRRFIPDFATIAIPLTNLLTKAAKSPMEWTEDCEAAFRTLKEKICSSPVLQSHDFNQRFLVQVDASATGVGAVLAQGEVGAEKPVVYISRKLLPRETRYSTVEKECLAIKWSLESLRYYLLGREFDLETDHRALTWTQTMKDHNSRVMRWYLSLQPYKFKVRHRPGQQNVVADYLSRYPDSTRPREGGGGGWCDEVDIPAGSTHTHTHLPHHTHTHIHHAEFPSPLFGCQPSGYTRRLNSPWTVHTVHYPVPDSSRPYILHALSRISCLFVTIVWRGCLAGGAGKAERLSVNRLWRHRWCRINGLCVNDWWMWKSNSHVCYCMVLFGLCWSEVLCL